MEKGKQPAEETEVVEPTVVEQDVRRIEIELEVNVQRAMDTFDPWRFSRILEGKPDDTSDRTKCTRENHKCKQSDAQNKMCTGCAIYQRVVREHSLCPVGGHGGVCDAFALHVADPLIRGFMTNSIWLKPAETLTGKWFVKCPITFHERMRNTMHPIAEIAIRRNMIKLYDARTIIEKLGLIDHFDTILESLVFQYKNKNDDGTIYFYDELIDLIAPIRTIGEAFTAIGIDDIASINIEHVADGLMCLMREQDN